MIPNKRPLRLQPATSSGPDYSNTLNKRLAFLWTDGVSRTERVTGAVASVKNAPAINTRSGRGLNCSTGQANIEWPRQFVKTSDGAGGGDFTLLALAAPTVGGGAVQHIFAQKNDPGGAPFAQASILANSNELAAYSSGSLAFFTYATNDSGVEFAGGIDGNFHVFLARRTGTDHQLWIDGKLVATVSKAVRGILQTPARYTAVGSRGNGTSESMAGAAVLAAGWDRALSEREIAALGKPQNLWRLFGPRRIWVPVSAGGGATDLVLADATHGHTSDNVVLTTDTALAIQEATHGHSSDNIVLTTSSTLVINDATHGHSADSLTLTTASTLAVQDATHAHAADSLVPSTDSTLAVQDAAHAHSADNLTLAVTGQTTLVVADATHAHTADSLALTTDSTLAVQDALHGHTAESLTLSTGAVADLVVQDATHGHTADSLTFVAGSVLTIEDAIHAQQAENLALVVESWLVVADALHAQRADNIILIDGETPIYAAIPASRKARGRFGERPAQLSTGRRR